MKDCHWKTMQNKDGIEVSVYEGPMEGTGVRSICEFEATPREIMDYISLPGSVTNSSNMIEKMDQFEAIDDDNV